MSANDPRKTAYDILRGEYQRPEEILKLAKRLKELKEFGLARRVLARARNDKTIFTHPNLLEIFQQSALCTYKDPNLPADSRLDRALEILESVGDLSKTENTETLGIAGAIYKRKWEVNNQKPNLERSLVYYLRGHAISARSGQKADQGYNAINAAFILDLLAHQEEKEAEEAQAPRSGSERERIAERRAQARAIREEIVEKVAPLVEAEDTDWLQSKWWYYSTVAEALFGLGTTGEAGGRISYDESRYEEAVKWLEEGRRESDPPEWEYESTARQLAALARLQVPVGGAGADGVIEGTPPWEALKAFLGGNTAPVRSAFEGKIGLGLSGGGFRASLFHIGVLAKLAELDVLRRVEVISCVSGGSIIGAHYYLKVRKLLQSKADGEVTREDYVKLVAEVEREFLAGVQRNVRTRVASNPLTNLKMIFVPSYSRTTRAGDLYESEIFSLVDDGEGGRERWLNELNIHPAGKDAGGRYVKDTQFNPTSGNWLRENKVPALILNAATLNTGHTWHFTTSYMGEPPAGIDSQIDCNDRYRRMYYKDAPKAHRRVRLGHAVAASACVQGVFEPLALEGLYPDRVVRLVDGGTCDNQGVGGLLEQDCNVLLISDGSGQMGSLNSPSNGMLGVPLRSTSILQARIRQSQYQDLCARHRSRLLRGLMFVHLKNDLDVDPVDWVRCPDPYRADDEEARPASREGMLTSYGIAKDVQRSLAAVRTDLDSFSDVEAFALMTSGYRQTEYAFAQGECVEGFTKKAAPPKGFRWRFLAVEDAMKGNSETSEHVERLLGVSDMLAFKILKLSKAAAALAVALLLVGLAVLTALAVIAFRVVVFLYEQVPFREAVVNGVSDVVMGRSVGAWTVVAVLALLLVVAVIVVVLFGRKKHRGEAFVRVVLSFAGVITSLVAWVHLLIFDRWFLKEGGIERYSALIENPAGEGDRGADDDAAEASAAEDEGPRGDVSALDAPHAHAHAPAVSVVGAVPVTAAAVELPRGNGHAADSDSNGKHPLSGGDVEDPDARQN
jgi:predicted acylesterase/phospholipase RssA